MSLQSVGNSLSLQQIMQMLQQQSLTSADPEAAAADGTGTSDPAGQNLPAGQSQAEDAAAGQAPQVTSAKATLDPSTIKTLLQIQEEQTQASDDVLIFGGGGSSGDPLLDALSGNSNGVGQGDQTQDPLTSLIQQMTAPPPAAQSGAAQPAAAPSAPMPDLSQLDPAQLQSILAAMTGSAASGDAIAGLTQSIMSMLGGDAADTAETPVDSGSEPAPVAAAEE